MIVPEPFSTGDCIGLVAPSSPISREETVQCVEVLRKRGYQVKLSRWLEELLAGKEAQELAFLAGTARQRAEDVNRMFQDRRVRAIFCVRGGYGSAQILPYLDYSGIRENPKVFVGYSDITAVHMAFQSRCGLVTFHGPMVKSNLLAQEPYEWESLCAMAGSRGSFATGAWTEFRNPKGQVLWEKGEGSDKMVEGILTGGNLSVLLRLVGTGYLPDMEGKILLLEDVGETMARIYMGLVQLEQAKILSKIRGVLLGDLTGCQPGANEMTEQFFTSRGIPVLGNVCSDHRRPMGTLPLGANCRVDFAEKRICLSSGVFFWKYPKNCATIK